MYKPFYIANNEKKTREMSSRAKIKLHIEWSKEKKKQNETKKIAVFIHFVQFIIY